MYKDLGIFLTKLWNATKSLYMPQQVLHRATWPIVNISTNKTKFECISNFQAFDKSSFSKIKMQEVLLHGPIHTVLAVRYDCNVVFCARTMDV